MIEEIAIFGDVESLLKEWYNVSEEHDAFMQAIIEHEANEEFIDNEVETDYIKPPELPWVKGIKQEFETEKAYLLINDKGKFWIPKSKVMLGRSCKAIAFDFVPTYLKDEKPDEIDGDDIIF